MTKWKENAQGSAGFSLLELLIVVAILLIFVAVGIPRMSNVMANVKLRSSMTAVSGLLQNARISAVQRRKTMTARHFIDARMPHGLVYYVKKAADLSFLVSSDPQIQMDMTITAHPTPDGPNAPTPLNTTDLGDKPVAIDPSLGSYPSFNSRGLPCAYSSGSCRNSGFVEYFRQSQTNGLEKWAAVSVSPAGRIKTWFWNGAAWTD